MLPWRQVVPFSHFFQASLSVRDVLREIIVSEDKPLTDAQLVSRLADKGYHIAVDWVALLALGILLGVALWLILGQATWPLPDPQALFDVAQPLA
jgi:hypothetical protein